LLPRSSEVKNLFPNNNVYLKEGRELMKNIKIFIQIVIIQLISVALAQPGSHSVTYEYTGSEQTFTVPTGTNSITVEAWGAQGGSSAAPDNGSYAIGFGGKGGYAVGENPVTTGQVLHIYVGGEGESSTSCTYQSIAYGGYNGGGNSINYPGGGGGGASDVRIGGTDLANRIIVAAGGGGGAHGYNGITGGAGGGLNGQDGIQIGSFASRDPGHGGTQTEGGYGQSGSGSLGQGASGSPNHAGGGGGGYYGGGCGDNSTGGGGGSSYIGGVANGTTQSGVRSGNGQVIITYTVMLDPITSVVINGTSGYRMLSSPVSGAIYGDLLEELWTQGAEGSDQAGSIPNIYTYGNGWNAITDLATDNYITGSGILVYVYADTDLDGTDDLPVTLTVDGTQNTSPVTIAINQHSDWNLLGNPYGYSLSIQQLAADNAGHGAAYIWDNTTNAYKTHNGITGDIADGLIAPFQGFWSRADAGAASYYTFSQNSISPGTGTNYRTTTNDTPGSAIFSFHVGDYTNSVFLSFSPDGHINLDNADASRLLPMSSMEHLTSMIHESGKSLSINNLPLELSNDISFPMDVMMLSPTDNGYETQAEQVNLTWDIINLPAGISLELMNNITGQNINLTGYPSANINLPSKGGFSTPEDFMATYPVVGDAQFTLSVNSTLAGQEDVDILPEQLVLHNAYPNPFNPSTLIRFDLLDAGMVSLDIFDLTGKQVSSLINEYMIPGSHQISWNPGNLSSGVYIVKLSAGNTSLNQKITYIK
jgi:hypothetical protein